MRYDIQLDLFCAQSRHAGVSPDFADDPRKCLPIRSPTAGKCKFGLRRVEARIIQMGMCKPDNGSRTMKLLITESL